MGSSDEDESWLSSKPRALAAREKELKDAAATRAATAALSSRDRLMEERERELLDKDTFPLDFARSRSTSKPPLSPMEPHPPLEFAPPPGAMRQRRNSMVPVQRAPRKLSANVEEVMVGSAEMVLAPAVISLPDRSVSVPEGPTQPLAPDRRGRLETVAQGEPQREERFDEERPSTFLVEDLAVELAERASGGDGGGGGSPEPASQSANAFASFNTTILANRMKRNLMTSWKATISVDMWYGLKKALDIPVRFSAKLALMNHLMCCVCCVYLNVGPIGADFWSVGK